MDSSRVLIDTSYRWATIVEKDFSCSFIGYFLYNNSVFKDTNAAKKIIELFNCETDCDDIKKFIDSFRGHFGFIIETPYQIIASVDKIRSYPVFYGIKNNECFVSNAARYLQQKMELYDVNEDSVLEFKMAGYVTGAYTLFKDLFQLQPGEFVVCFKQKQYKVVRYFQYLQNEISHNSEKQLREELHDVTFDIFKKMIDRLDGRPVLVPLSAGYDSRLVLCMLKHFKYDNVKSFFYGAPGNANWERKYSYGLSKQLGISWTHLSYSREYIRSVSVSDLWKKVGIYSDNLCSLPNYTYLFYMKWLVDNKMLSDDTVIINGQSGDYISGNHLKEIIALPPVTMATVYKTIIDKHFAVWLNLILSSNIECIKKRINSIIQDLISDKLSSQEAASLFDFWEWNERQCKYVVNGQRMYDYWGYKWEMPLWDVEYLHFWKKVPWTLKMNQKLYIDFLEETDLCGAFKNYKPDRSVPLSTQMVTTAFSTFTRLFPKHKRALLIQKYLRYFIYPNNFYYIIPYLEYLKTSVDHRSIVSYYSLKHLPYLGLGNKYD